MTVTIREISDSDLSAVCDIYNHYVDSSIVTFEESRVDLDEMQRRVNAIRTSAKQWLVAEKDEKILGYAYACQWRARSAYRFAVEATIYLDPEASGQGLGSQLYGYLLDSLEKEGVRTVIGVVGLPNSASEALHEKLGFEKTAHLKNVGYKFDRWLDVGYWQKNFF